MVDGGGGSATSAACAPLVAIANNAKSSAVASSSQEPRVGVVVAVFIASLLECPSGGNNRTFGTSVEMDAVAVRAVSRRLPSASRNGRPPKVRVKAPQIPIRGQVPRKTDPPEPRRPVTGTELDHELRHSHRCSPGNATQVV